MPYYLFRSDPEVSPPPGNDQTLSVPLAAEDRAIVCVGEQMFASSDLPTVGRSEQERRIGRRSHGRFGDVARSAPSHGSTLNISFNGIELDDFTFENLDQNTRSAVADLVYSRHVIVSTNPQATTGTAGWLSAAAVRAL